MLEYIRKRQKLHMTNISCRGGSEGPPIQFSTQTFSWEIKVTMVGTIYGDPGLSTWRGEDYAR